MISATASRLTPVASRLFAPARVRIAANGFGSLSLFPANARARHLFGGDEPAGTFASCDDAAAVANANGWEVVTENLSP